MRLSRGVHALTVLAVSSAIAGGCTSTPASSRSEAKESAAVSVPNADASRPCRPAATAADLTASARAAIGRVSSATLMVTPPLPSQWPEPRGLSFFAYRVATLPTGRIMYRVHGPLARVDFAALNAAPVVVELDASRVIGDEERGERPAPGFQQRLDAAAETLVEVVAGCHPADTTRSALAPYLEWLALTGLMGRDVRHRAESFVAWLEKDAPHRGVR